MTKLDPIIAVKDVEASANWYQKIFGFKRNHGGDDFAVLVTEDDEIVLCLHKWGEHQHPTLTDDTALAGNGLLLYFRTDKIKAIRKNVEDVKGTVEKEIQLNPNSIKNEFSFRDLDGYYLTVSEFHTYEG